MSWPVVSLKTVATLARDGVAPEDIFSGTLFVGLENIKRGGDFEGVEPVDNGEIASTKFSFSPKHVLYGKLRPYLAKIALPDFEGVCSTDIIPIMPGPKLERRYLAHYLLTPRMVALASDRAIGANLPRLSPRVLLEFPIPLPPLDEQRRIAAILDQAEELRAKRRAAIALLDQLPQAIFLEMFGDPFSNPKLWPTKDLRSVTTAIIDCPHSTPSWTSDGVTCLRTSNLTRGNWDWSDHRYVSEETYVSRSSRGEIEPGDIILSREGTVGIMAIVPEGHRMCLGQRLVQVKPNTGLMTAQFLMNYLLFLLDPARLKQSMVGSTAQHLNVKELRDLKCLTPLLSLQSEFSARVLAIQDTKTAHQAALAELNVLFASLQNQVFRGDSN
jgi:type I restriction enzyme S subunit